MSARQTFTEPHLPWPACFDDLALEVEATQQHLSNLRQFARKILAAGTYPSDWISAAQRLVDTGDDAADLEWLMEGLEQSEAFDRECEAYEARTGKDWTSSARLCALERDTFNPEPLYAAAHLAGMTAGEMATLNAEWGA